MQISYFPHIIYIELVCVFTGSSNSAALDHQNAFATKYTSMDFYECVNYHLGVLLHLATSQSYSSNNHEKIGSLYLSCLLLETFNSYMFINQFNCNKAKHCPFIRICKVLICIKQTKTSLKINQQCLFPESSGHNTMYIGLYTLHFVIAS